ncbi:hypothetical protein OH77DRAFT_288011 [Trametes cingulata]|nr:hypothetical protein OH77DRAFT_288011 [Trametes cingulata]
MDKADHARQAENAAIKPEKAAEALLSASHGCSEAFIHRLPDEILVEIFVFYGKARTSQGRAPLWMRPEDNEDGLSYGPWGAGYLWIPLMRVCRFWRTLALATPRLWQVVDVWGSSTRWMELALVRSRSAPLQLFLHKLEGARAAVPLILPHVHRLERLLLPPLDATIKGSYLRNSPDLSPFLPLVQTSMPTLVELRLSVECFDHTGEMHHATVDLSRTRYPALRVLRLACVSVSWSMELLPRLTCLDLRACIPDGPPLSRRQFLDVLEHCSALEELRLLDMFVSASLTRSAVETATANSERVIHLPALRKVVVADLPSVTSWLFSCLNFRGEVSVTLIGWLSDDEVFDGLHSPFYSLIPHHHLLARFFPTTRPTRGKIDVWQDAAELKVSSDQGSELSLQLLSSVPDPWDPHFAVGVLDFRRLFAGFPLESLLISGDLDQIADFRIWLRLLDLFPKLRELEVVGDGHVTALFVALKHTLLPAGCPPEPPLCPELRSLRLELADYAKGDIELIVAMLHRRAFFQLAPMESMKLDLSIEDREEFFGSEIQNYSGELRSLCPQLSYVRYN